MFEGNECDMARPLRIKYEGIFCHITDRGNERKRIFSQTLILKHSRIIREKHWILNGLHIEKLYEKIYHESCVDFNRAALQHFMYVDR